MTESRRLVDKLWSYCNLLRDDGVSTIEYVEQLTYLIFLKMAHERANRPIKPIVIVPAEYSWQRLLDADGDALDVTYRHILEELGKRPGALGTIFRKAQNRVQDPAKLKRLIVELIDKENWSAAEVDVKGDAYEYLLAKGAEDVKSGAGQYFTPRVLIEAMVDCMRPTARDTVCDPACGTGGFLLWAYAHAAEHAEDLTPEERDHLRDGFVAGTELVDGTARLAAMNLLLHGIGQPDGPSPVDVKDSLTADTGERYSMVLANPPFGRKSTVTMIGADGRESRDDLEIVRQDFWVTTANKQLNFVQHIKTILAINGRAAVVLPDNVLFEGGAGETVRRRMLAEFDVHTLLRLPTGIFYAGGVKANVLFFDKKPASDSPWTSTLWVYDFRTNKHFTLKQNQLRRPDLDDFVASYAPGTPRSDRVETERFKSFAYDELLARDKVNLDITWLRDESLEDLDNLPEPAVIAREIVEDLAAALSEFEAVAAALDDAGSQRSAPLEADARFDESRRHSVDGSADRTESAGPLTRKKPLGAPINVDSLSTVQQHRGGRAGDPIISSWDGLLAALDVEDAAGVAALIDERVDGLGWLDTTDLEYRMTPIVDTRGTSIDFPFPLQELWDTVAHLDLEVAARASWAELEEAIYEVEGFKVRVDGPEYAGDRFMIFEPADEYPYERAAKGALTLSRWHAKRIAPNFPDFEVQPLNPVDGPPSGNTRLATLRNRWADE